MISSLEEATSLLSKWKNEGPNLFIMFTSPNVLFSTLARVVSVSPAEVTFGVPEGMTLKLLLAASCAFEFSAPGDVGPKGFGLSSEVGLECTLFVRLSREVSLSINELRRSP